ncbi:MAG: N-acetyltransferase [Candidatus Omnitrophota bacterium]
MIKKITIDKAKKVHQLINSAAKQGQVLERSLNYIYENIRDFWVYLEGERIVGCCSLHVVGWQSLAEIKSLVVDDNFRKKNIGTQLVQKTLEEAKSLKISEVFALTFSSEFFKKQGFYLIDKNDLPHKIWTECLNCRYFPDCKEEAVIIKI